MKDSTPIAKGRNRSPRLTWLRRQSVALAIALLILGVTAYLNWHSHLMPENIYVPMPQAPAPNARDFFNAAEREMVDRVAVDDALENVPYALDSATGGNYVRWPIGHSFSLQDREKLAQENAAALAKLRVGLGYTYLNPQDRSFAALMPYYAKDRAMARLLELEGQTDVAQGKWGAAGSSYIDAIQLGTAVPKGSMVIGSLTGIAIQAIGRHSISAAIPHLNAAEAEADARRLYTIEASDETTAAALQNEKWFTQGSLLNSFRSPSWRKDVLSDLGPDDHPEGTRLALQCESPRTVYDNYSRYMDQLTKQCELPWPEYRASKEPTLPTDPANQVLLPVLSKLTFEMTETKAWDRLAEAQLALQAYHAARGSYPDTVDRLVPTYIPAVPLDPFSDNQPLRYRKTASAYLLYSIGPDAIDNAGVPAVNRNQHLDNRWIAEDATGDIRSG